MKYTLAVFAFILILPAYGMKKRRLEAPEPQPSVSVSPLPVSTPSPLPTGRGHIALEPDTYYSTASERTKIKKAEIKVNQVIQSECFSKFMSTRKLLQTNGRTPAQVVAHIQSLKDTVPVNMYYRRMGGIGGTSAVAYRQPPEKDVNLNRAYFGIVLSDCEWASTLAHESLHAIGEYGHDFNWSPSREYSVPYSVNHSFDECCD